MKIDNWLNKKLVLKEIGARIRDFRINKGLRRKDLAIFSGVSESTITRIEEGSNIMMGELLSILSYLGLQENVNLLIPDQSFIPTDYSKLNAKKRKRASVKNKEKVSDFVWEEDKK